LSKRSRILFVKRGILKIDKKKERREREREREGVINRREDESKVDCAPKRML
jgi:hypothetical protein